MLNYIVRCTTMLLNIPNYKRKEKSLNVNSKLNFSPGKFMRHPTSNFRLTILNKIRPKTKKQLIS